MKAVNDVAARLHSNKLKGSGLMLNFLHRLQSGMDAASILETLASCRAIAAPSVKTRREEETGS